MLNRAQDVTDLTDVRAFASHRLDARSSVDFSVMPIFLPFRDLDRSPVPYDQCPTLKEPQPPFTFAGLAHRVMMFSRERMVDCGARLLWGDFEDASGAANTPKRAWTRTWAAPLMALGLMYGKPAGSGGAFVEVQEFLNLEWELFQLPEFSPPETLEAQDERAAIEARLLTSRLKNVDIEDAIHIARVVWNLSHATWQGVADIDADPDVLARDWTIYKRMRELMLRDFLDHGRRHRDKPVRDLVATERALFLTTPHLFLRTGCAILSLSGDERPPTDTPGFFSLPKRHDEEDRPDVSLDDYSAVIRALGIRASVLQAMGQELLYTGTPERRRSVFDSIRQRPLIAFDDYPSEDESALIIGPARFFKAMSRFLLFDTVEHFGQCPETNAASRRGDAFEWYLNEAIAGTAVKRLEPDGRKTPDFEWVGTRYRVLIEAKVKVIPNMIESPSALVSAWDNLMEAVEQASAYASRFPTPQPAKWVLIIVVNDAHADEQTSFRYITSTWRLLEKTPLVAVSVLRPDYFEYLILSSNPDKAGEMLERLWLDAGQGSPLAQPPTIDPFDRNTAARPRVLEEAYREILASPAEV